jgi:hypothetical protein
VISTSNSNAANTSELQRAAITLSHSLPKPNTCRNLQRLFMVHRPPFHLCRPASAAEESCMHLAQDDARQKRWANGTHSAAAWGPRVMRAEQTLKKWKRPVISQPCAKKKVVSSLRCLCLHASALLTLSSGSWNLAPKKLALCLLLYQPLRLWHSVGHRVLFRCV